jgi:hypothetical protein
MFHRSKYPKLIKNIIGYFKLPMMVMATISPDCLRVTLVTFTKMLLKFRANFFHRIGANFCCCVVFEYRGAVNFGLMNVPRIEVSV